MTSRTLPSPSLARPGPSWRNLLARLARRLIEADARARGRRLLENLPDRLRADAGLPPRSSAERAMPDLFLRVALLSLR